MKVIPRLDVSYSNEKKLGRTVRHYSWQKTLTYKDRTAQSQDCRIGKPKKLQRKKKNEPIFRRGCRLRLGREIILGSCVCVGGGGGGEVPPAFTTYSSQLTEPNGCLLSSEET